LARVDERPLREQFSEHLEQLAGTALTQLHPPGKMDSGTAVEGEIERLCVHLRSVLEKGAVWRETAQLVRVADDELTGGADRDLALAEVARLNEKRDKLNAEMGRLFNEHKDDLRRLGYWLRVQQHLTANTPTD
jgi:hypothetical protein